MPPVDHQGWAGLLTSFNLLVTHEVKPAHLRLRPTGEQPSPTFFRQRRKKYVASLEAPAAETYFAAAAALPWRRGGLEAGWSEVGLVAAEVHPRPPEGVAAYAAGLVFETGMAQKMRQDHNRWCTRGNCHPKPMLTRTCLTSFS